jgi:IclR family transcriptional regulator, KDG regulon repressor
MTGPEKECIAMSSSLQKAVKVLALFTVEKPEWSVSEVALEIGLPKSSVSELLSDLATEGLLHRLKAGHYHLGWRLVELGQTLLRATDFRTEAREVMQEMVRRWGESMHLAVLESGQVMYLESLQATQGIQIVVSVVGGRLPAHCTSIGKVLLAHLPRFEVAQMMEKNGMKAFTSNTVTALEALSDQLEEVRRVGYAYDIEEVSFGMCCVGAPIYNFHGKVVAALSFSIPTHRFHPNRGRYTKAIVESAQLTSERLGYYALKTSMTLRNMDRPQAISPRQGR